MPVLDHTAPLHRVSTSVLRGTTPRPSGDFLSFGSFFQEAFVPLNRLELPIKRLHREVCAALHDAILGDLTHQFIVINIPPRVGKTKMMEALACWGLGYFPDMQIIYTSYANDLACQSSRYVQAVLASPWYQELFPRTQLGAIQQADHFTTDRGGVVYADGVGGSLTGRGAGLKRRAGGFIIVDDPSKPNEALSRIESEKVRFWFENTLKSRRNSSQWTPIIVCMQRLDADDLSGFLLENYPKDTLHLKFPAMVDEQSVIPETVTTESLEDTRRVNPFTYAAQYQQEPVVFGGNLIKLEDFRYYQWGHAPQVELKVFTCDTALRAKTSSDWSVIQCWGRAHRQAYLLDQVRGKWEPAELLKNFAAFWRKHHVRGSPVAYAAVEESGTGQTLVPELRKLGIPARGLMRTRDKVTRVMEALPYQATGMVLLPKGAPWLGSFEAELATFRKDGKSRHDDQCVIAGTKVVARHAHDAGHPHGDDIAIQAVRVGDDVLTRQGWRRVLEAGLTGYAREFVVLRPEGSERALHCTSGHPVLRATGSDDLVGPWAFAPAEELRRGDWVLSNDWGEFVPTRLAYCGLKNYSADFAVYNLKVEGAPEFFADGLLVHNCDAFADGVTIMLGKGTSILQVLGSRK